MNKLCKNCNKEFSTRRSEKQHCSPDCYAEWRKNPEVLKEIVLRRKETNFKKYGVDNAAKLNATKEKAKATCLKKYGKISPSQNSKIKNKQIQTLIENYGVDNPQKSEEIKKRQQETLLKNYGVNFPLQSEAVLNKTKNTNLKKYGVENVAKAKSIKEKTKITNFAKYGGPSPASSEAIRESCKKELSMHYFSRIQQRCNLAKIKLSFNQAEYTNSKLYKQYPVECLTCNTKFEDCFTHGRTPRCPYCFPAKDTISKFENEIVEYIQQLVGKEKIQQHNRELLSPKEIDVYLPEHQIAIELNGNYWHSENSGKKYKNYHINKTKRCEQADVTLLHIFEDEWIQKQDIIKNKLAYILQPNSVKKIHGRKCEIKPVSAKESNEFLTTFHLQGEDKSSIRYGAYFENKLVAVATFGKLRIALGEKTRREGVYELYRYCSVGKVAGILSKLISRFIKDHSPKKIITYADRRFSNKKTCAYSKCGFSFVKETSPNYWYLDKNYGSREHRFNYRKSVLSSKLKTYDSKLTEWENMQANGYDRIWDCGHLKYEMQIDQA